MFRLDFFICLAICGFAMIAVSGEPQHYILPGRYQTHYMYPSPVYSNYPAESTYQPSEFRQTLPYQLAEQPTYLDSRLFFGLLTKPLLTLTFSTTTSTSTSTVTTFCTTSTAALTTCSAGRRRRGLFYNDGMSNDRVRRGLFYNEDDLPESIADSVKSVIEQPTAEAVAEGNSNRELRSGGTSALLQSTLSGSKRTERQLFSFTVATTTITTTTTTTSVLTAVCSSTTGFAVCPASG